MNARKLTGLLLIAPFTGLLIATKISIWLSGKDLLVDADAVGHFLWVSIVVGIAVILTVRGTIGTSFVTCVVAGIVVFGLMDLVNLTHLVQLYKENSAAGLDPAEGLAKLAGGAVYGLWFWFLDPFSTYAPRKTLGRTLRGGGGSINDV